ncbi:hypothetical protein A2U01_0054473, partial [Trifolium medium]|nr:hypothetical protein [Trifolium medium]
KLTDLDMGEGDIAAPQSAKTGKERMKKNLEEIYTRASSE